MKKIIFILVAVCLGFVSCKKHNEDVEVTTPMVTISFEQKLVTSNSMVRSSANEFLDIIEEQTPSYINVTLKNLDLDKTYTCKSNESITIPLGNYEVSGCYNGSNIYNLMNSAPNLKCDNFSISIKYDTKTITLNTYYNCYAVFALIDECKTCNYKYGFSKKNKYYVAYFENGDAVVTLIPYDDSTEFIATTYNFSTIYTIGKVYAEYGKYYVIHPQKVDKTISSFELVLENMTEGEI